MATEIELKAHVYDHGKLKALLFKKAEYVYVFEKEDTYWFPARGAAAGLPPSGLRLRSEKRGFPDGKERCASFAAYKNKEVRDNIEVNDEREFLVDPAAEFECFLKRMGLEPGIAKQKRGWAFVSQGIHAELAEVKGLGWFVELEIIADNNREKTFADGKKRLLDFLDSLGIEREALESRFYTEMLKELSPKNITKDMKNTKE